MIFEQLFDIKSSTYTYIISSGKGREALIIDPVIENTLNYLEILKKLDLKLVKVIDTHIHADHVSGLNELSEKTKCIKVMGEQSQSEVIDIRVKDNDKVNIENKYNLLASEHENLQEKLDYINTQKKSEQKKEIEFSEKIDELNQETDSLLEEIDKWQM